MATTRLPMRGDVFEAKVRRCAALSPVIFTYHAEEQMALPERDLTSRQVLSVLRKGTLLSGPDWDEEHENWVGKMTHTGGGMRVTVVCAIREDDEAVIVITAY